MFDVGFTEILLIGVVSLVVIGPERLPDVARTAGRWIGKMQRFVRGVKRDIASELESGDLKKLIGDQREQIDELRKMVRSTTRELESTTHDVVRGAKKKLTEMEDAADGGDAEAAADEDVAVPTEPAPPVKAVPPASAVPTANPAPAAPTTSNAAPHDDAAARGEADTGGGSEAPESARSSGTGGG